MSHTSYDFDTAQVPALAELVTRVPGVAHLDGGRFGQFSTYLPNELVQGVSFDAQESRLKIAIAIYWPHPPHAVAAAVRAAAATVVPVPIDIYVNDMLLPEAKDTALPTPAPQPQLTKPKEN
ncbi:MAG: hypothetical protein WAN89_06090 [Lawsonella sp.]|nr:hypothetical protein [Mycobacteriales bacterium]